MEPKKMILEFYIDEAGEYRWRIKARNGRIMADCAEGYKEYRDCTKAIHKILKNIGSDWYRFRIRWHKSFLKDS